MTRKLNLVTPIDPKTPEDKAGSKSFGSTTNLGAEVLDNPTRRCPGTTSRPNTLMTFNLLAAALFALSLATEPTSKVGLSTLRR